MALFFIPEHNNDLHTFLSATDFFQHYRQHIFHNLKCNNNLTYLLILIHFLLIQVVLFLYAVIPFLSTNYSTSCRCQLIFPHLMLQTLYHVDLYYRQNIILTIDAMSSEFSFRVSITLPRQRAGRQLVVFVYIRTAKLTELWY